MTEKTYTQKDMDSVVNPQVINELLDLRGLADDQVAEGRRRIEQKYNLAPGILGSANLSSVVEAERQKIYPAHYEATMEEVEKMTPDEYLRWRELGAHLKKTQEQVALDTEQEERDRLQAEELALIESMTVEELAVYRQENERKAQEAKEGAAKLTERERQDKLNALRRKDPATMSMPEYADWTKIR